MLGYPCFVGTENVSIYTNTDLIFCDIENIHIMRSSIATYSDLMMPSAPNNLSDTVNYSTSSGNTSSAKESGGGDGSGFFAKIEESGWLRHLSLILKASVLAAEKLHLEGASVLVHCSDGW